MKKMESLLIILGLVFLSLSVFFAVGLMVPRLMGREVVTLLHHLSFLAVTCLSFGCMGTSAYLRAKPISEKQARRLGLSFGLKWVAVALVWAGLRALLLTRSFPLDIMRSVPLLAISFLIMIIGTHLGRSSFRQLTQSDKSRWD